ncbi:nitroreductase family protein [Sphingobium nicotianae]|uniref:Nitroreductase family protein n=1 Tax=Sphingobium nicotianae TaxID=2782607 RepID=A0A9X1DCP7_9SPHN|nr:nitroreductase family protein [Sphingobium nicotianae]MBT2187489.1 nitroreductase family protein [Sphingobium nicotianae]
MSVQFANPPVRTTDTALDPIFLERWSPRAFDGSPISQADLRTILDAARWAPSAFNYQPWRFLYSLNGDEHWEEFLSALIPFNQGWAKNASALLFIASDTRSAGPDGVETPLHSHSFDTGAAWAQLALQSHKLGYHTHGMTGIDFDRARDVLGVPERFRIEAAIAIGRIAPPSVLPEGLRGGEVPSGRKPLEEIAFPGKFIA